MKLKKVVEISIIIIVVLYIFNGTPITYFLREEYTFSNYNGDFRFDDLYGKGVSPNAVFKSFEHYKSKHVKALDTQLYRTFTLKPWRIWEWNEWRLSYKRFTLPYISEKEILENRKREGLPLKY